MLQENQPEPIDLSRVMQETFVEKIHFFETLDSTNTTALARAEELATTETLNVGTNGVELFLAEQQTAGRGRGTNVWWSDEGALTFSLLTRPIDLPAEQLPRVSLAVGLAVCLVAERFAEQAGVAIKWPNDIFLAERKVAGILIELAKSEPKRLVIGVGLNVNNRMNPLNNRMNPRAEETPPEIRTTAISLRDALPDGELLDRTEVLIEAISQVEKQLSRLIAGDRSLSVEWSNYSFLTGREVRVVTPNSEITGLCESIADDGALRVQTARGLQTCYGGHVAEWGPRRLG